MSYELIKIQGKHHDQVTEIILNPPPANIISVKMMDEISDCLKIQQEITDKKLIIFSGEGQHFSYGASVEEHLPEAVGDMLPRFHRFIGEILGCKIPTLAKVSGCCFGGGFELALACTFIFADQKAKLSVPEIQLAVFPPPASILLPLRCGDAFASQMILTGEPFGTPQLLEKGIVNAISEEGNLDADIDEFIKKSILPKSAAALRIACTAARTTVVEQYKQHIKKLEELYLKDLMSTRDAVEGIKSFTEKRKPKWVNA